MTKTNIKIDKDLGETIRSVAQKKFKFRSIDYISDAVREVLIHFLKQNQELLDENNNKQIPKNKKQEVPV